MPQLPTNRTFTVDARQPIFAGRVNSLRIVLQLHKKEATQDPINVDVYLTRRWVERAITGEGMVTRSEGYVVDTHQRVTVNLYHDATSNGSKAITILST